MHVIMPHISCVCNEQEFPEALKSFQDIYVLTGVGIILRHIKLKGGRYVRIQVKEIPGVKAEELLPQNIKEEINFLPNGKIPGHLLDEIVDFFKAVMVVKKAENEAMAHILWNEKDKDSDDKGYRIAIPNQTVSKASVRYENDHIEKGDVIVLDIHSHNTMGAFFSGTDDGDDKKGLFFSGVVGNLNWREPEFKWRLNINDVKIEASIEDIFDIVKKEVKVPSEWLEKVSTNDSSTFSGGYRSNYSQDNHGVYSMGKRVPPAWERNAGSGSSNSGSSSASSSVSGSGGNNTGFNDDYFGDYGSEYGSYHWRNGVQDLYTNEAGENHSAPSTTSETKEVKEKASMPQLPAPRQIKPGSMTKSEINQANKKGLAVEEVDSLPLTAGEFDANAVTFGTDAAESYEQITAWLSGLEGADELLLNLMSLAYAMLSSSGQEKLGRNGF